MSSVSGVQQPVESAEVMRSIAHELRQPLSTIESIAYYLSLVSPRSDDRIHEQLVRLQRLVEQSNWILTSGLQLTDSSPASPEQINIDELVSEIISARPAFMDYRPRLELAGGLPTIRLDRAQGSALVENLLTLFRQLATEAHPVTLRTALAGAGVALEIESSVPGYRNEAALGAGTALSLASAHRIVAAHRGSLQFTVDPEGGIRLRVVLP